MKLANLFAAAAVVAGLSLGTTAQAAPIVGSGQVAVGVSAINPVALIDLGTTFSFSGSFLLSGAGNLGPVAPDLVSVVTMDLQAALGASASFTAAWGDFAGTVVSAKLSPDSTPLSRTVSVAALGEFTPKGPLSAFSKGAMSLTFSATQTNLPCSEVVGTIVACGADDEVSLGQTSASYTIASPPSVQVPEPASLALLGIALGSAGFFRRRR